MNTVYAFDTLFKYGGGLGLISASSENEARVKATTEWGGQMTYVGTIDELKSRCLAEGTLTFFYQE